MKKRGMALLTPLLCTAMLLTMTACGSGKKEAIGGQYSASDTGTRGYLPQLVPVSYTHLDVYKRQSWKSSTICPDTAQIS